jgi:uncharacterized protein YaaQ
MKMILAIIQEADVRALLDKLIANGLRATRISSTGGFLRAGNSTLLIGVEDDQVPGVVSIIRSTCRTRKTFVSALPYAMGGAEGAFMIQPIEVEVGGAHIFVWKVERAGQY